jgi:hypothetical protein
MAKARRNAKSCRELEKEKLRVKTLLRDTDAGFSEFPRLTRIYIGPETAFLNNYPRLIRISTGPKTSFRLRAKSPAQRQGLPRNRGGEVTTETPRLSRELICVLDNRSAEYEHGAPNFSDDIIRSSN